MFVVISDAELNSLTGASQEFFDATPAKIREWKSDNKYELTIVQSNLCIHVPEVAIVGKS